MAIKRKMNFGFATNPDNVSITTLPPSFQGGLGGIWELREIGWQFVQLVDAGPAVAGDLGYWKLSGVTILYGQATRTIGNSNSNMVAGVFTNATILNNYTLVRKRGVYKTKSNGTTTAGNQVMSAASANALAITTGILKSVGVAMEADGATTAGFTNTYLDIFYL